MDTITLTTHDIPFPALEAELTGDIITPEDPRYDDARLAWALAVEQRPAAVTFPQTTRDVERIVRFAAEHGLRVAPQSTGHNAHPLEGRLASTILLKTERMRGVEVDPIARRARVAAGAVWADVTGAAAEHGLVALAGSSSDVGVVGYTLGGGLSWLARRYGLAANHVSAIEVVTASGERVIATREHHPELFWALRGGGGSFGVVTALEIELLPITHVYAGAMFWPQERAREVLQAWRDWASRDLPDDVISAARVLNVPPFPEVPEPLRGRRFVVVELAYLGEEAAGAALAAPLRHLGPEIDTLGVIPSPALSHLHMDPEHPVPGKGDGLLFDHLTPETIDAFVAAATGEAGSALLSAEIRQLGGAIGRPAPSHGALSSIAAPFAGFAVGAAPTRELQELVVRQVTGWKTALEPWTAGYDYLNFAERPREASRMHADEYTLRRLRAVKAAYDPTDRIQANHPIRPADR